MTEFEKVISELSHDEILSLLISTRLLLAIRATDAFYLLSPEFKEGIENAEKEYIKILSKL